MSVVVLILIWVVKEIGARPGIHIDYLPLPDGTTLAQCEAEHQPATDFIAGPDVTKLGYKCVEIPLRPTDRT